MYAIELNNRCDISCSWQKGNITIGSTRLPTGMSTNAWWHANEGSLKTRDVSSVLFG